MKTAKSSLFLTVFVALGAAWALIVTVYAQGVALSEYHIPAPWAGMGIGVVCGWLIIALGLRLYVNINHKNAIRAINSKPLRPTVNGQDVLEPFQRGHRVPYFDARVN